MRAAEETADRWSVRQAVHMTADELMQLLSGALDEPPLDAVRHEADSPCLMSSVRSRAATGCALDPGP